MACPETPDKAYGYEYVVAERNRWIPELKQPRVDSRQQIDRPLPTGQIKISKKFIENSPNSKKVRNSTTGVINLYLAINISNAKQEWSDIEKNGAEVAARKAEMKVRKEQGEEIDEFNPGKR